MFSLSSTRIRPPISRRSEGVRRRRIKTACGCSNESTALESPSASTVLGGGDVVACVISLSAQATSYNCCRVKPMGKVLSIGEAAKLAGVSVQTLRHYDKLGLLAPSHLSAAGYRRYSERDCERLRLIRALREVGFDLDTIGQLLASKIEPDDAIRMRFEALEAEHRALRRRQLLLLAAINGKRKNVLARLQQKYVLAKLDRFERESFLERHFAWAPHDTPESQAVWRAAIFNLPEHMDDAQLEAWLELAEIAADERFHRTLKRQFEWTRGLDESKVSEWNHTFQRL